MKFTKAEPDENFPIVRFVSENNVWEIGIRPMMFGHRVSAGLVGSGCVEIDYCGGADGCFVIQLLATVVKIFSSLPETITLKEVKRFFPTYQVKPIDKDPCWEKLKELAANLPDQ